MNLEIFSRCSEPVDRADLALRDTPGPLLWDSEALSSILGRASALSCRSLDAVLGVITAVIPALELRDTC
jgi:hypothetical protein